MSAPVKPPQLSPDCTYIHITSPKSPEQITQEAQTKNIQLSYVAPVGELQGEYIFELTGPRSTDSAVVRRDEALKDLKGVEGVKGAKIMEQRMRAKR